MFSKTSSYATLTINSLTQVRKKTIKDTTIGAQYNLARSLGSLPNIAFQLTGTRISTPCPSSPTRDANPAINRLDCFIKSTASYRLSPSEMYLNSTQLGSAPSICLNNFSANPPPWMTLFVRSHSSQPLFVSGTVCCARNCSSHKYTNFGAPIECCSCAKLPVNISRSLICWRCKNSIKSAKNAVNDGPFTSGDRNWKHANFSFSLRNSSHAVVMSSDCCEPSDVVGCWNARGPRTGIIEACDAKRGKYHVH